MAETDPEWAAGRRARVVHCARGGRGSACSRRLRGCEMSSAPVHRVASRRERDLWRRRRRSSRCGEASGRRRARRRRRRVLRAWWRLQRRACPVARGMSDWTGQQRGEGEGTDGGVPESDEMAAREGDEAVLRAGGRGVVARARCRDVALLDSTHQSSAAELDGDDELAVLRSRSLRSPPAQPRRPPLGRARAQPCRHHSHRRNNPPSARSPRRASSPRTVRLVSRPHLPRRPSPAHCPLAPATVGAMMYGFGDDNPAPDTVALMEELVVEHISDLVRPALARSGSLSRRRAHTS